LWNNGWWVELRLTAVFTLATIEHGKVFDHVIPMWIRFLKEVSVHAVMAQIGDMDDLECV
jgi:hypothetical protein